MDDAALGSGGFAGLLRRFRDRSAFSQEELAARAGLTAKAISALERGERRRPYPHTVRALADALALDDAERQALAAAARPGAPQSAPSEPRSEAAPLPLEELVGRDDVLDRLTGLLRSGSTRLLTVTGPGGVGKTSVALAVARRLAADEPATPAVVELAPLREPRLVLPAVARALGVPQTGGPVVDRLAAAVGDRRVLVVLDNLEQVLGAAPDIAELLTRCPALVVLATSRAPLRIRAEREWPLEPLPVPAADDAASVASSPSARVFLERARAAGGAVDLTERTAPAVAAICRRLDGLPLALELAAAHARYLAPAELLTRLDAALGSPRSRDLPERQRTMRATIDWSYDLLTAVEQALLRRLAVFPGGFDLPALETVFGADVLGPLAELVEQSLVVADAGPYRLFEPVRGYAAARLAEAGEESDAVSAATAYYRGLASAARAGLRGPEQVGWLERLRAEHANLAATTGRLLEAGDHDGAARFAADLWLYWALSGTAVEGSGWLSGVAVENLAPRSRAALQVATAGLRYASGDLAGAVAPAGEAVAAARAAGDAVLLVEALVLAGVAGLVEGKGDGELTEARALAASIGDAWAAAHAAAGRGQWLLRAGDRDASAAVLRDAEATARELGSPFTLATVLNAQASLALAAGREAEAAGRFTEATRLAALLNTTWTLAYALPALAGIAARRGRPELATELFAAAAQAASVTVAYPPDSDVGRTTVTVLRDALGVEAFERAWDRGRALRPRDLPALLDGLTD